MTPGYWLATTFMLLALIVTSIKAEETLSNWWGLTALLCGGAMLASVALGSISYAAKQAGREEAFIKTSCPTYVGSKSARVGVWKCADGLLHEARIFPGAPGF